MQIFDKRKFKNIEYILPILVLALSLFGLVSILMATASPFTGEEMSFQEIVSRLNLSSVKRQAMWIVIGVVCMLAVMLIDYKFYSKIWIAVIGVSVALLVAVRFLGVERGGTRGWFAIGESMTFQPSEVVKLATILLLAKFLADKPIETFVDLLPTLAVFVTILGALLLQMDIGTTLVYIVIFLGMLFISGVKLRYLGILLGVGAVGAVALWFQMGPKQQARIINFITNPQSQDQLRYSMIAIGSGRFSGKGLFSVGAMSQLSYIPYIETDFIFAVIGETFGFLGCAFVIFMYCAIIFRLWQLMKTTKDRYGSLIIAGIMFMLMFHIFENIGMTIGVMPITGIPLPFISYGGTNFATNMIAIGLVLSVRFNKPVPLFEH